MPEQPIAPQDVLDALLVTEEGVARTSYQLCHLPFEVEAEALEVNLVPIVVHQNKLLVAVPFEAWNRTVAERILPRGALSKAVLIEVLVAYVVQPEVVLAKAPMKLWVALMDRAWSRRLVLGRHMDAATDIYCAELEGGETMPYGPGLAEVSDEHFAFQSALSAHHEGPDPGFDEEADAEERSSGGRRGDDEWEERMGRMEVAMFEMKEAMSQLVKSAPQTLAPAAPVGARPKVAASPKRPGEVLIPGLDPTVVRSAREAGIPDSQLRKLAATLRKPTKMGDAPKATGRKEKKKATVLSETEEEEEAPSQEDEAAEDSDIEEVAATPVEKALLKLTKIVGNLSRDTKKAGDLDSLLENVDVDGGDASQTGSSRGKAAAYQKLRSALTENPKAIYSAIEALLEKDFNTMRSAPGSSQQQTSARAWLEHRSRVGNFPTTIRYAWCIAGIWDCLRTGAYKEARARAAVAIAACDQTSLDAGSWLLSQEVLLEQSPPMQAFQSRRPIDQWEQTGTKLLDDRMMEVLLWKVKNKDNYLEARRRLSGRGKGEPSRTNSDFKPEKGTKDKKAGKGGGKSEKKGPSETAPPQP